MLNYFKLGILTTRLCNQQCYYCNNYNTKSISDTIDLDYFSWVLNEYHKNGINNLYIELSGGEPALITNINDVINFLLQSSYVTKIDILSNGLIRKNKQDIIAGNSITCIEHTCLNITGKMINYFYDDITFFNNNFSNVYPLIVLDETTTDSLINNFEYFYNLGLYTGVVRFKILTPKNLLLTPELLAKYEKFHDIIKQYNLDDNIFDDHIYINRKVNIAAKKLCAKVSSMQYIDLENKKIGQCSMNVEENTNLEVNSKNIKNAIEGKLFNMSDYCNRCVKYDKNAYRYLMMRLRHKNDCNISKRKEI